MFTTPKTGGSMDSMHGGSGAATVIARGVRVEGEFVSEGDVLIEGEVHGTLTAGGTLTIGPEAKVKAEVKAGEAIVGGNVEGNITVTRRLELKSSSTVVGDINAETISVEGGASLSGRVSIGARREGAEGKSSQRRSAKNEDMATA